MLPPRPSLAERSRAAPSLWQLTQASGPLDRRCFVDEAARIGLDALRDGTTLAGRREELRGATVMLRLSTQLAAALALLELDGLARRIVLCTPDLSAEHFRSAVAIAGATAVVTDQPVPELSCTGLTLIPGSAPGVTPFADDRRAACETEWALFTSGTTGPPKLALHSLRTLIGAMAEKPATGGVWSTFYDIRRYGGLQILLRALLGGGSMVFSGAHEEPRDFFARVAAAGVTFLSGTPTHWRRALLCPLAGTIAPPDVRLSGEVADQAILDKLRATYPQARINHAFASTEAGVAFEVGDGFAGFPAEWVGQTRNGVELRVQEGTLRIRSPRTAARYLGEGAPPLMDAEKFVDTKDIVELRAGRWHFGGRRDGVINVGGLKVHPEEVEAVVNRHPLVEMSLVRAKRSPIIGAVVVVDVVLTAGPERPKGMLEAEILDACRAKLAAHKVPAAVRVVPSLAVNAAGKLIRMPA
jgi:acyl-coenzyme A synthetase/AMP-(fatty) acid ligase